MTTLSLVDGRQTIVLPDGDAHLQMSPGQNRVLFVALAFTAEGAGEDPNEFVLGVSDVTVEDATHDLPLSIQFVRYEATGVIGVADEAIFADGFESGNTGAWSATTG